tara:strand:+ start:39836 stop:40570 length:735 start_codon:yes stop_codon:yes gene_type:complete
MKFILKEPIFIGNELSQSITEKKVYNDLKKNGFTVVRNFCKNPSDVVNVLKKYWNHKNAWQDDVKSDTRLFGIDHKVKYFENFFLKNKMLINIYKKYINSSKISSLIMANRVLPKKNNIGSGGKWHRDDKDGRQLKFILYLTDVKPNNGGFNYLKYTHKPINRIFNSIQMGCGINTWNFTQDHVNKLSSKYEFVDVTGKAGDLIIVDTSGIHKGSPIYSGSRIALTQYLWDKNEIPEAVKVQMI